jgi:hypothetical protein
MQDAGQKKEALESEAHGTSPWSTLGNEESDLLFPNAYWSVVAAKLAEDVIFCGHNFYDA